MQKNISYGVKKYFKSTSAWMRIRSTVYLNSEFSALHLKAQKSEPQTQRADVNRVMLTETLHTLSVSQNSWHSSQRAGHSDSDKPERTGQRMGSGPGFIIFVPTWAGQFIQQESDFPLDANIVFNFYHHKIGFIFMFS